MELPSQSSQNVLRSLSQRQSLLRKLLKIRKPLQKTCLELSRILDKVNPLEALITPLEPKERRKSGMLESASMESQMKNKLCQIMIWVFQWRKTAPMQWERMKIRIEPLDAQPSVPTSHTNTPSQLLTMLTMVMSLKPLISFSQPQLLSWESLKLTSSFQEIEPQSNLYLKPLASVTKLVSSTPSTTRPKKSAIHRMIRWVYVHSWQQFKCSMTMIERI